MDDTLPQVLAEFAQTGHDLWLRGWAEGSAGNMSLRLDRDDPDLARLAGRPGPWTSFPGPEGVLSGALVLLTASGASLRSIATSPSRSCGVIEIDARGTSYRTVWGFEEGRPTSEILTHLLAHAGRISGGCEDERAIVHAHTPNIVALAATSTLTTASLTRLLWSCHTESIGEFPAGVELIGLLMPGSPELAEATMGAFRRRRAVCWTLHGLMTSGKTPPGAFSLMGSVEKAAALVLLMRSQQREARTLGAGELRRLAERYGVDPDSSILIDA